MRKICRDLWGSSTYTGFAIYRYLLVLGGQTIDENIENPTFDKGAMVEAINRAPRDDLEKLWTGGDGLCTSWCIAVAHKDPHRQYVYGDTGNHRACYARDGMVIDSSARIPIYVGEGPQTVEGKTWTMQDGRLYSGVCASLHNLCPFSNTCILCPKSAKRI